MNFKRILMTLLAASVVFSACEREEELGAAKLTVTPGELSFDQSEGTAEVEILATRDWLIASQPDWVAVSVTGGQASTKTQKVSVSVNSNSGHNRTGSVVFTIGLMKASLKIAQTGAQGELKMGTGTQDDPFTVAGVIAYVNELGKDVTSPSQVYVKGKVATITEEFSAQYGNGTFTISDDGTAAEVFTCYRILYLGNRKWTSKDAQIEVGNDVVVCGNVVNYKGNTPETSQGTGFLYSLNGKTEGTGGGGGGQSGTAKGTGTEADPFNVAAAIAKAVETGQTATADSYYIKGKVKEVTEQFAAQYGNATFTMVDEGYDAVFTAYRVLYFDNQKWTEGGKTINANDEVVVYAKVVNFMGNTPETSGGYVYSINGEKGSGTNPGGGGGGNVKDPKTVTVAEFIAASESNDQPYKLTGKVSNITSTVYGNFDLVDATGSVYVYGLTKTNLGYGASNDKSFGSLGVNEGDEITIIGFRGSYNDKVEVMYAYLVSGGSGNGGGGGGETGDGLVFQFTDVSGLTGWPTKAGEATSESTQVYKLNGVDYTFYLSKNIYTSTYNGASYLMLASKTNGGPVYLGLPAIEGKKLVGVTITTSSGASKNACGQITSDTNGTVVSGGDKKKLDTQSADFSWTLSGTAAKTMYYYSSTESGYNSQIVKLVLKYSD